LIFWSRSFLHGWQRQVDSIICLSLFHVRLFEK
jgi:hypothetical protein